MKTPQLKIEGRSGCPIRLSEQNGQISVIKTSSGVEYNSRLKKQIEKQLQFTTNELTSIGFFSPQVFEFNTTDELYWFSMEYVSGLKYSTYLTSKHKEAIEQVIDKFKTYFKHLFDQAILIEAPKEMINQKLQQLNEKIEANYESAIFKAALASLKSIPEHPLYIGKCHGDFTLSNMLFLSSGKICAFDLLDSFIESPLMDWVKLKQDITFKWSIHVENEQETNQTKLIQVLNYIDKELSSSFAQDNVIKEWEQYLQIFNLMRIVPYAKDPRDITFLENTILKLL